MPTPRRALLFPVAALTLLGCVPPSFSAAQTPAPAQGMAMHHDHDTPSKPSTALVVHAGTQTVSLSLSDLQALPQVTVSVLNAHIGQNETYAGPLVADVLAKAGLSFSEKTQHDVLDSFITATGTDGYFVVFSGAELQPGLHKAQTIVALTQAGQPLTRTGAFQLVDPLDVKPARWVRNLTSLTIHPVTTDH